MSINTYKIGTVTDRIALLADVPELSAEDLKEYFDKSPQQVADTHDNLIDFLQTTTNGDSGADNIGATAVLTGGGATVQSNMEAIYAQILAYALGEIPNDSITDAKMAAAMKKGIAGGLVAYDDWLTSLLPASSVIYVAKDEPPDYYLECDGSAISRTTYANLFSVIGTAYGAGDGTTTFALPDLRGEFIRGWDNGRGVDTGRVFGSAQSATSISNAGQYTVGRIKVKNYDGTDGTETADTYGSGGTATATYVTVRPRNVALLPCIKY